MPQNSYEYVIVAEAIARLQREVVAEAAAGDGLRDLLDAVMASALDDVIMDNGEFNADQFHLTVADTGDGAVWPYSFRSRLAELVLDEVDAEELPGRMHSQLRTLHEDADKIMASDIQAQLTMFDGDGDSAITSDDLSDHAYSALLFLAAFDYEPDAIDPSEVADPQDFGYWLEQLQTRSDDDTEDVVDIAARASHFGQNRLAQAIADLQLHEGPSETIFV